VKIKDLIKEDIKKLVEQGEDDLLSKMTGPLTPDELAALRAAPMAPGDAAVDPSDPAAMADFEKRRADQQQQQSVQQTQQFMDPSSPEHQQWAQSAQRHQAVPQQPTIPGSSFTVSADQMRQMTPDQWSQLLPPNLNPQQPQQAAVPQGTPGIDMGQSADPDDVTKVAGKRVAAGKIPTMREILTQAIKKQRSK